MDAVFKARDVYRVWHEEFFVKEKLLPASRVKIKMFCSDLAELGYSYHTVVGTCATICQARGLSPWDWQPQLRSISKKNHWY